MSHLSETMIMQQTGKCQQIIVNFSIEIWEGKDDIFFLEVNDAHTNYTDHTVRWKDPLFHRKHVCIGKTDYAWD